MRAPGLSLSLTFALALSLVACSSEPAPAPAPQPVTPSVATTPARPQIAPINITAGQVDMITMKNDTTEVPGRFETVSGSIKINPHHPSATTGTLTIDLASWHSDDDTRDGRIKTLFFNTASNPTTTFELTGFRRINRPLNTVGDSITGEAVGTLHWRALNQDIVAPVEITRTGEDAYTVAVSDFDISIAALNMSAPLQALITECQHKNIGDTVKVSLTLAIGEQPVPAATTTSTTAPKHKRVLRSGPRKLTSPPAGGRTLPKSNK
ncbi:MAG: YceI family protein [Oligoflexia bacterium]|nr:YceI family protein [Oligoflexia bacterium]